MSKTPRMGECADGVLFDQNGYCPQCGAGEDDTCGGRDGKTFKTGLRVVQLEDELQQARAALAGVRAALTKIRDAVKTPPFTNMSRADMREIADSALAAAGETPHD